MTVRIFRMEGVDRKLAWAHLENNQYPKFSYSRKVYAEIVQWTYNSSDSDQISWDVSYQR